MRSNRVTPFGLVKIAVGRSIHRLWSGFLLVGLTGVASFFLSLVPPLLIRRLVDQQLSAGIWTGVWWIAGCYLAAYAATSLLSFVQEYLTAFIGQRLLYQLRLMLVEHLAKLPISYFNQTPLGDIISRVTADVDTVSNLFSTGLLSSFTDLFRVGGVLAGMYLISPRLFLVSFLVIPVIYVVASWFRKNMLRAENRIRRSVGVLNSYIQEVLNGLRLIKAYGKESAFGERFQQPLEENVVVSNTSAFYVSAFPCVTQFIRAGIIALVVWLGARTSLTDTLAISIGGLAAMVDLLGRLLDPVESIANQIQVLQQAISGLNRLAELMSVKPEERGRVASLAEHPVYTKSGMTVSLRQVRFGYQPDLPVIKDISLDVPRGSKLALIGRTGAGKTTLMNLVAGLYRPWSGEIRVAGVDPHSLNPSDRRRLIGVVPQTAAIFEGSVRDNITLRDETIELAAVIKAAELVGLHEHIMQLPQGYDTELGAGGTRLSYGQAQLLSIARAIVCDPPVLLLDEPTSGLDTITESQVFAALRAASAERTIITISHRVSGIVDADTVVIMANGEVAQSGRPEVLAGERGWYSVFKQLEDLGWQMS
jgi:ATP-binding cassette subfamily B protein